MKAFFACSYILHLKVRSQGVTFRLALSNNPLWFPFAQLSIQVFISEALQWQWHLGPHFYT